MARRNGAGQARPLAICANGRLLVAAGAALFLSLNIAPTAETLFLAVNIDWWLLTLVVFASLLMSYAIVFYADFRGGRSKGKGDTAPNRIARSSVRVTGFVT